MRRAWRGRILRIIKSLIILFLVACCITILSCESSATTPTQTVDYSSTSWQLSQPQTNTLLGIWGIAENDVFAVGDKGTILHYDGATWSVMESGTTVDLRGVWGTSATNVYAVGYEGGTILHYDGLEWSTINSGTTNTLYNIWGSTASDIFIPMLDFARAI